MQKQEFFLNQLEEMLNRWDTLGEGTSEIQKALAKNELCRSVLSLFIANSGPFRPILTKVTNHLFDTVDLLESKMSMGLVAAVSPNMELIQQTDSTAEDIRSARLDRQLRFQVKGAEDREGELHQQIAVLALERDKLADLIQFQQTRRLKLESPVAELPSASALIKRLAEEKDIVTLTSNNDELRANADKLVQQITSLKTLNGKYATQATELAARLLVIQDHNDRIATSLAMQQEELLQLERENVVLKAELSDFSSARNFPKLVDPNEEIVAEVREIAYGYGSNLTVPKHLQANGVVSKFRMSKETAILTVHDILTTRQSQRASDICTHIQAYFAKRHGPQALSWAYGLDESTRLYDTECNLNAFGQISRKVLSEQFYNIVNSDVALFLNTCESLDSQANGADSTQTLTCSQVLAILQELFPSYSTEHYKKIMTALETSIVSQTSVHYQMLFPNMDRLLLTDSTPFSAAEVRSENSFSNAFKELILDDAVTTTQLLVDALLGLQGNKLTLPALDQLLMNVFEDEDVRLEMGEILTGVFDKIQARATTLNDFSTTLLGAEAAVQKSDFIHFLRTGVVLRQGVLKPKVGQPLPTLPDLSEGEDQKTEVIYNFDVKRRKQTLSD